jgi:hypothetical protein
MKTAAQAVQAVVREAVQPLHLQAARGQPIKDLLVVTTQVHQTFLAAAAVALVRLARTRQQLQAAKVAMELPLQLQDHL